MQTKYVMVACLKISSIFSLTFTKWRSCLSVSLESSIKSCNVQKKLQTDATQIPIKPTTATPLQCCLTADFYLARQLLRCFHRPRPTRFHTYSDVDALVNTSTEDSENTTQTVLHTTHQQEQTNKMSCANVMTMWSGIAGLFLWNYSLLSQVPKRELLRFTGARFWFGNKNKRVQMKSRENSYNTFQFYCTQ